MTGAVRSWVALGRLPPDRRLSPCRRHFRPEIGTEHRFTAEAVIDTSVRLIKRRSLEAVAESNVVVARNLLSMTTNNLRHAETTCCRWDARRRSNAWRHS